MPQVYDWSEGSSLEIGSFCSISSNVQIYLGGEHRIDWVTTYPMNVFFEDQGVYEHGLSKGDVIIGNDVWISGNVIIFSGIIVGDGAVIANGSIINNI